MRIKYRYNFCRILVLFVAGLSVISCASTASEVARGKNAYTHQQYDKAYYYLSKAATRGDANAQYALGYMYYYGKGVDQNTPAAIHWMQLAAAQHHQEAIQALQMITSSKDATQAPTQPEQSQTVYGVQPKPPVQRHSLVALVKVKPIKHKYTAEEGILLHRSPKHYVIQLMGSYKRTDVLKFIRLNQIEHAAHVYLTTRNGSDWFVLVYGDFPDAKTAVRVLKALPARLKVKKPWVKSIARVQHELRIA